MAVTPAAPGGGTLPGAAFVVPALVIALSAGLDLVLAGSAALTLKGHTERAEWALFVVVFAAVLPASLLGAWNLARRGLAGWSRALGAAGASLVLLMLARAVHGAGFSGKGAAGVLLAAGLALAAGALMPRGTAAAEPGPLRGARLALGLAAAVAASAMAFAPGGVPAAGTLALSVAVAVGAAMLCSRIGAPELPARVALAFDLVVSALVVLLVLDVVGYTSDGPELSSGSGLTPDVIRPAAQIHLDYFLRPLNDLLHGRPLLVESASQYGVLNFHLLAAWVQLAPVGYGPLGLFAGVLTAAQYLAGYWIVRLAGCGPLLAAAALGAAVVVTVLAGYGSPAFFPSTGGLRFGLPFVLVLAVLLRARRSGPAVAFGPAALAIVAAGALWSVETFVYVSAAFVPMAAFDAAVMSASVSDAARRLGGHLARGLLAVAVAHLVFGFVTLVLAGSWPDWGWYIDFFRAYSTGGLSQALGRPWSPVWLIGAIYFASFAGLAAIATARRGFAVERRSALLAAAGLSGVGAAFLSYFVGRSLDVLLVFVALPAFMLGAIWLGLALQAGSLSRPAKVVAVALSSWLAAVGIALASPQASDRWPRTALAHVLPGGRSLAADLERVWDSPPMDPRSPAGERLVREHFRRSGPALVIAEADLAQEVLVRTGRGSALPLGMALEDDLLFDRAVQRVRQAAARLRPGTVMLLQRDALTHLNARPRVGVISVIGGPRLSRVQLAAAAAITSRFELEPVAKGAAGFEVVRLRERLRP